MLYARTVALVGVIALITTALLIPADYSRSEMVRVVSDDISDWDRAFGRVVAIQALHSKALLMTDKHITLMLAAPGNFLKGESAQGRNLEGETKKKASLANDLFSKIPQSWERTFEGPYWQSLRLELMLISVRFWGLVCEGLLFLPVLIIWLIEANEIRRTRLHSLLNPFPWLWAWGGSLFWLMFWGLIWLTALPGFPVALLTMMPPAMAALFALMVSRFHQLR